MHGSFTNENGLRVQKTINGVATKYTLHGKNVVHMTSGTDKLHLFYDAQNRPTVVVYNGTAYAYVKSLQGDIVAILDENGNTVVSYGYDAWGAPLWCTGELAETLGKVQPFRYRGYVFDEETGLYYLRSRYYNPRWGRFVNADEFIGNKQKLLMHNLYAYCLNTPSNRSDAEGFASVIAISTLLNKAKDFVTDVFQNIVTSVGAEIQLAINGIVASRFERNCREPRDEAFYTYPFTSAQAAQNLYLLQTRSWFYSQVQSEAPMDYKVTKNNLWWALKKDKFYFRGEMITFEEYGNINYGYVGSALRIHQNVLFAAGGLAASMYGGDRGDYRTFFDSQEDHDNIAWGISIYQAIIGEDE